MSHEFSIDLPRLPLDGKLTNFFKQVGDKMLEQYSHVEQGIVYKSDDSPQTIADRNSHIEITRFLQENTPYPVFSEEAAQEIIKSDTFWTLDPLDGTKDFIDKTGEFSIMASFELSGLNVILIRLW